MGPFDQLPLHEQRTRLKDLGRSALELFGIPGASLRFVTDTTNYICIAETSEARYVLRVDPEHPDPERKSFHLEELLWLSSIRKETELQVPSPVSATDGAMIQLASTPFIPEGRWVTMMRWMPGRLVGSQPGRKMMRQLGGIMSRLHEHTENFELPAKSARSHIDWQSRLHRCRGTDSELSKALGKNERDLCAEASRDLLRHLVQGGSNRHYGLIHADMHTYNCLRSEGQISVIDFDDCCLGSHFYDLAVPLSYLDHRKDYKALKNSFFEGYLANRTLPENFESKVNVYMVARALDMARWVDYIWPGPELPAIGQELLEFALKRIKAY